MLCTTPRTVLTAYWIIQAIRISVMPQHSLAGGEVDIGGDEAAEFGVVVTTLEIVPACFFVIHIAAIAEGLFRAEFLLSTSKHRRCDTTALVRNTPEALSTQGGLNKLPFVHQRPCSLV